MKKSVITLGKSTRTGPANARCLYCGYGPLDGVTGITAQSPEEARTHPIEAETPSIAKAGALSICWKCGAFLVFTDEGSGKLGVRAASKGDIDHVRQDADLWRIVQLSRKRIRARRKS
jgi:hypothetical protein